MKITAPLAGSANGFANETGRDGRDAVGLCRGQGLVKVHEGV